ncbi:Transcription termination factor Rho [Candidatus Karelsulcia muelleri]|uniref:Transcription termination factor Rho n=1 Tax=Candidatus Karelsulcia muelleri TaxID=336810 RepID=A0A346E0W5_9FLAO|nr:Transcription termination factor Rho [Candidatus Karelsulcia muelleri]
MNRLNWFNNSEKLVFKKNIIKRRFLICEGVLEIINNKFGFLRSSKFNYLSSSDDIYISNTQIKSFCLKTGDTLKGSIRYPKKCERYFSLKKIFRINGRNPFLLINRVSFKILTPWYPNEKLKISGLFSTYSTRIIDMFVPIGKGQRGMIVAPPKTGKTTLLKEIANTISFNHPEIYLIILLIDERPEEVTDIKRDVKCEVISSTFDETYQKHVKIANLVLKKSKRLVEGGHDVVLLLDSITRLARAYNTLTPSSGKVLSGGVEAKALHKPKKFFGAARNIEGGGSLSILATAIIETGSKMDEIIFEEFKGTGNFELQLDRKIANKRIFPAINLLKSSTRKDNLLIDLKTLEKIVFIKSKLFLIYRSPSDVIKCIRENLFKTSNNDDFLELMSNYTNYTKSH